MNFKRVNNITGWVVFLIAMATYMFSREARGSLWDCGEFVSSAYKMELPHPPGAPMFTLIGRFFIILFGDNPMTAANAVNFMSALASAATILFLFWSITHFARKMFVAPGEELTGQQIFTTMSAGAVGALAYAFSDSFWFSAVEGEVYALSSFFTALVFWAMLKWEHADEHAGKDAEAKLRADRWIIFLSFMMGLSIGVHLLNLLSIPAIVMIYYFRRYFKADPYKADVAVFKKDQLLIWTAILTVGLVLLLSIANFLNKENDLIGIALVLGMIGVATILIRIYLKYKTIRAMISAFLLGCIIVGIVQVGVIQFSMKGAGLFDVFFKNSLDFPFYTGFAIYFIALTALIVWAFRFTDKNITRNKSIAWFVLFLVLSGLPFFVGDGTLGIKVLKFIITAGVAVLIGYFFKAGGLRMLRLCLWCYAFMMLGYCLYFTVLIRSSANPAIDMNNVDNPISLVYYLSREQYGSAPLVYGPHFDAQPDGIDSTGEMKYVKGRTRYISTGHGREYTYPAADKQLFPRVWDASNDQGHAQFYVQWLNLDPTQNENTGRQQYKPTYRDNAEWFFTYQMNLMYWRYFMWNFAGKQNDIQGMGNVRDGNWITGISFLDNARLGDQNTIPDSIKNNKAHNKLYMLPFILGILGCVFQYLRNKRDWIVNFLLFFFTGIAVVLYLNQPGNQPRERDYAYVGSFYAFAIWIGLAVVALVKMAQEKADKKGMSNVLIYGSVLTFLITLMSSLRSTPAGIIINSLGATAIYILLTVGITYIGRAISSGGQNARLLNIATTIICLIAPLIMAQQEWDDHDRSQKTLAPDLARDYLESCAPNAILFTFGDNDTYPLWYEQEVEGVRPDIRIINYSLLGIDWYINQLRYKVNQSDSIDVIWTPEQMEGGKRDYVVYNPKPAYSKDYVRLYSLMKDYIGSDDPDKMDFSRGEPLNSFPTTKVAIPVDRNFVLQNKTVNPGDSIVSDVLFDLPAKALMKNDLAILNIISANNWKRPIYFTSPFDNLGFGSYLRKDGMTYRFVPIVTRPLQNNWVFERTMQHLEDSIHTNLASRQIYDDNDDFMYKNLLDKFEFGGANKRGTYFDEENRRHLLNIRSVFGEAAGNMSDAGRKEEAQKLLDKIEAGMSPENIPYGMVSRYNNHNQTMLVYLEACYKAGKTELAEKIRKDVRKDLEQQKRYYEYLRTEQPDFFSGSIQGSEMPLNEINMRVLEALERRYAPQNAASPVENQKPSIINTANPDSNGKKTDSPGIKK